MEAVSRTVVQPSAKVLKGLGLGLENLGLPKVFGDQFWDRFVWFWARKIGGLTFGFYRQAVVGTLLAVVVSLLVLEQVRLDEQQLGLG
jgi:hypothetical protein